MRCLFRSLFTFVCLNDNAPVVLCMRSQLLAQSVGHSARQ